MKLYCIVDGPPSLAVRQAFKYLDIPYDLITIDWFAGDHLTEEYAEKNPQKEIPVLDDDGFFLGESNAILQYICDKYKPDSNLYPKDPETRAIVNHRLCFNLSTYYRNIFEYSLAPLVFDCQRTPLGLKKVNIALSVFNTYLKKVGKKYAAADHLTIADFPLINSTMCLEAISFDLSQFELVSRWYTTFKTEHPDLWEIASGGMEAIMSFEKNPLDLSSMQHPIHSVRKTKDIITIE